MLTNMEVEDQTNKMDSYDEDLSENPFFQSLLSSCPELFGQCVLENWLICVPRRDSLPKYAFTIEDFTHHILKPIKPQDSKRHWSGNSNCSSVYDDEFTSSSSDKNSSPDDSITEDFKHRVGLKGNWNYRTLTHINVEYSGRTLILDVEVPVPNCSNNNNDAMTEGKPFTQEYVQIRKEILFDETFYTNDRKYKVMCIASPLNSKADIEDDHFGNSGLGLWNLTSLRDCIDFISIKGSMTILENYDAYIKLFLHNHHGLENFPLAIQKDLVKTMYIKSIAYAESTGMIETDNNLALSEFLQQRLNLATETYVLNGIYRTLISAITSVMSAEDANLNKIMRNLAELHPQDLNIDKAHWNSLNRARHELGRISSYSSPLGKLTCLKRTLRYLKKETATEVDSSLNVLSTDDLIPIWLYLIIKNPLGNWMAQLEFLRQFRFSAINQKDNENSFYIVTLEASLEHLKSGKVLGVSDTERDVGMPCDLGEAWLHILHQSALESTNPRLGEMLDVIRIGNCQKLEELVEEYELERFEESKISESKENSIDGSRLCHPLCNCEKCVALCRPKTKEPGMVAAVELTTEEGLTLLHVACVYGRPKVVDFLIGAGTVLEAKDLQGMTSLHYAASRGHQNALLLLLHAGASLEATNNSLNTPLHLASQNGHEACVKAMIYFAEHSRKKIDISARNSKGDTALHFASRWGFQGIVQILAEHGAAITVTNSRYTTPIDCAHNVHILKILQRQLNRRTLFQINHGDFVNIEMMQKENCGGIVMLISEPEERKAVPDIDIPETNENENPRSTNNTRNNSRNGSKVNSRNSSRRNSSITIPNLLMPSSAPRSRKVSMNRNSMDVLIVEETARCLLTVAEHLKQDPASPDFVYNYFEDYDPTEQDHVRKISVEHLESSKTSYNSSGFDGAFNADHEIKKLFSAISVGDIPLTLFYLGIPAEEIDNPENESATISKIAACHPLCPCFRCLAKNAGLGLGLNVKNSDGLTPLHYSVLCSLTVLVKILIRYGADINDKTTNGKQTALDLSIEKGFRDIEDTLIASGGQFSTSFCPDLEPPEFEN